MILFSHATFRQARPSRSLVLTSILLLTSCGLTNSTLTNSALTNSALAEPDQPAGKPPADTHNTTWSATWATALTVRSPFDPATPAFNDVTLRQIVRVSVGGPEVRVWFSNELGTEPLTINAATVARRTSADAVEPRSRRALRFNGSRSIVVAPGARVVSDPVQLQLPDRSDLAVSIHLVEDLSAQSSPASYHVRALQTSYIAPGNQAGRSVLEQPTTTTAWFYLAAVDVRSQQAIPVFAAFGDSITDGDQRSDMEPVDLNARYSDFLAALLLAEKRAAVINLGISGNQVASTFVGNNMQARLARDVLTQSGVTHVIVLGGINDLSLPLLLGAPAGATADQLIAAHQQIIARSRARGLTVIGGTITPSGGSALPGYSNEATQLTRAAVNDWIRNAANYDFVVDFDRLLADPEQLEVMRADLTADGLHPNSDGYRLMAQAVAKTLKGAK